MLDKDERGAFNGGGHPWDVEPGVTSTLLLFNGDSTPQKVNLRFGTPSGPWMRRFTLEPMETRAINVNELVGMQEKDDSGLALASNAQSGELGWQSDSTWVSGRLLQTSTSLGMARSFSCSQWVYACAFTLSPTPSLTLYLNNVGDLSEIPDWAVYTGFHPPTTCSCANPSSGNTTIVDSWQSGSTSIATITSGGTSSASVWQGVGVGSTTSYFYGTNMFLGGGSLLCQAQQPALVAPPLSSSNPLWFFGIGNAPPSGFTLGDIKTTLTAKGASGGSFKWTVTAGIGKASFASGSSQTSIVTSANSVILWSFSYSAAPNDVSVSLIWTDSTGHAYPASTLNFDIDSPYEDQVSGPIVNESVSNCIPTSGTTGYASFITYLTHSYFGVTITNEWVNESLDNFSDDHVNNWPWGNEGSVLSPDGRFSDEICVTQGTGGLSPQPTPPQQPQLSTYTIDHATQGWYVGSTTPAKGVQIQRDTLQRYIDHGVHLGIQTPVR